MNDAGAQATDSGEGTQHAHDSGTTVSERDAGLFAHDGGASVDAGSIDIGSLCNGPLHYETLRDVLLQKRCASGGCHSPVMCGSSCPPGPYVGPILFQPNSTRDELVNVPAQIDSSLMRVVPFAPDQSFLMQKLLGQVDPSHGSPMPPYVDSTGKFMELPADEIAAVRCWISGGAL